MEEGAGELQKWAEMEVSHKQSAWKLQLVIQTWHFPY